MKKLRVCVKERRERAQWATPLLAAQPKFSVFQLRLNAGVLLKLIQGT
jgi:hypothetical protein